MNSELLSPYRGAKRPRIDVYVTFNDGETASLEMQTGKSGDDLRKRAEYYTSQLVSGQLKRGEPYSSIKRVYQIFFLNCVLFPDSSKFPRRYHYQEEKEHDRLSEVSEIIFYELPKLKQKLSDFLSDKESVDTLTKEESWCLFMRYRHEERAKELIKRLCRKEEGIMCAQNAIYQYSRSYKRYIKKISRIRAEMENQAYEDMLKKDAREENSIEIAGKLKALGYPLGEIAEATGLSVETIESL